MIIKTPIKVKFKTKEGNEIEVDGTKLTRSEVER